MTRIDPTNFLLTARRYVGYKAELLGKTIFSERVGYHATPWAGAFIDVVAREAGLSGVPSFAYVPAALAEGLRSGNFVLRNPRPGDIAIFNFASTNGNAASAFSMPHAAIVTDVRYVKSTGAFTTIEGNTLGQGPHLQFDGVHTRIRHLTDVILFLRPAAFEKTSRIKITQLLIKLGKKLTGSGLDRIDIKQLELAAREQETISVRMLRPGTRNKQIALVQLALSQVTDLQGAEEGKWDAATASAFARFQRNVGYVGAAASGMPDGNSTQRLASETGLFQVAE